MTRDETPSLMDHQETGISWLRAVNRGLLADEPGLGKSCTMLRAAVPPVLIVSPAMLRGVWRNEVALWRPEWEANDWAWVSYSSLPARDGRKVLPVAREEYRRPWGTIIADECTALKNRKAKQTQALTGIAWNTPRLYLASGTPIMNWPVELFCLLRIIHEHGDRRYTSYWRFVDSFFRTWQPPYGAPGHREILGLRADMTWERFAHENDLDRLMRRMLRDEVLDLPPLTETEIVVEMDAEQRRVYEGLRKEYCAWVAEAGKEVLAFSDGAQYIKLAQATTGIATMMGDPALQRGSAKLDALRELLEEREGSPVVVFAHFRATALACVRIGEELGRRVGLIMGGIDQDRRDAAVRDFQSGDLDLLVATIGSGSEGITLHKADTAIFVERSWVPSRNEQCRRRLHRIGQTRPVSVIHLVTEDSLDQRITALLRAKTAQQLAVMTAAEFAGML